MPRNAHAAMSARPGQDDTKTKQWAKVAERREARELEECQATIKILKDKIEAHRKKDNPNANDYDNMAELKTLKAELKDEQKKVQRVETQLAEAVSSRDGLQAQLDGINDKLAKLPPAAQPKLSSSSFGEDSLSDDEKAEIAQLEEQITEQTAALSAADNRCGELSKEIAEKNKELERLNKLVSELEKAKVVWEKDLKTLRDGKDAHAKTMDRLNKELEAEQKKLDKLLKLQVQVEAGKKELKQLQSELRPLSDRLNELQSSHDKLTKEVEQQNAQITKARAELKVFRLKHAQLVALEKELKKLVEQDSKLVEEIGELKNKLDKEKVENSSSKAELAKVKTRTSSSEQQLAQLEKTIAQLEATMQAKLEDEKAVEEQVAALLPDITASHHRIKVLQAEYDRVNALCLSLENSNAGLREQAAHQGQVTAELEQSRAKVDAFLQQLNSINAQREELDKELEQLRQEEKHLKKARARTDKLRKELEAGVPAGGADGAKASPGSLPGWTRSIWGQADGAPSPAKQQAAESAAAELAAVEQETAEWKAKAQELEKTLAELTRVRDENAQSSRAESDSGAGPSLMRTPSSSVSDGFDDSTAASSSYVPDQRTQALLARMKETVTSLKAKISELQSEENHLRAENIALLMELAGA